MPGIVGLITKKPRQQAQAELDRMLGAVHHESFYEEGTWEDESLGVYVGWLAKKNSFSAGMPLCNERGDVTLVFSGEEYAKPQTVRYLKEQGHAVEAHGPSYLVHLYEEDRAFPASLNGMFHGLAADRAQGVVTLFNDRCGMHRICYHEGADAFYFAAEAKAILAVRPELRAADPKSFGEFVACSCVLENRTIFKGIRVLPAGSSWTFRNAALDHKNIYFDPRQWEEQEPLEPETYFQELRNVLSENLPLYFNGGEQIGMAVTGGLDTRVILACHPTPPGSLACYTFGGMFRDSQDVLLGRRVAKVCAHPHQVLEVGDGFLKRFPYYAEQSVRLTEGGVDVYRASDLYLSERARQIAPVKVVGTYGSEILRHAVMFKPMPLQPGLFSSDVLASVDEARNTYGQFRRQHPVTFAAFRQSPWYHHGILALEQSQLSVRSPFLDSDFLRTVFREPKSNGSDEDIRLRLIGTGGSQLSGIRSDRGVGGDLGPLSGAIARFYLEFTFKAEYAYDYGMPQWLTRIDHACSPLHLERLFLGRHKLLHFRLWYRDALSSYIRQILLDPKALSRPYIDRKRLEDIVQSHVKGEQNHTTAIHKLLTLELMHRLFFDANSQ
jgi:asparagine synthase (glutamine-hydrolysing)